MGVNQNNLIYVDQIDSRSADRTSKGAAFCLLNTRSISNKSRIMHLSLAFPGVDPRDTPGICFQAQIKTF